MRCMGCDGTGMGFGPFGEATGEACVDCAGTGAVRNDDYAAKIKEAVAKIGMVYVIRDDENGRVKIGTALNPLARLRNLQTGSSTRLRLMAMFPGGRAGERQFHAIWPQRRLAGEWFDDHDRAISRIILWSARSGDAIVWPDP